MAGSSGNKGFKGGVSPAQSGGRNTTFGGGKGGTAESRKATKEPKVGSGRLNNGLAYNIRNEAGDNARVKQTGGIGHPPPVHPGGSAGTKIKRVGIRKPFRAGGN